MKRFEFFEHTADAKFRAYGKNLEEAFSNAAVAMTHVMTDTDKIKKKKRKTLKVTAESHQAMLYDFLEGVLFLLDTEEFLTAEVEKLIIKGSTVEASLVGDKSEGQYDVTTVIKAITYNEMEVKEEKDNCMVQVVVDL